MSRNRRQAQPISQRIWDLRRLFEFCVRGSNPLLDGSTLDPERMLFGAPTSPFSRRVNARPVPIFPLRI